MSVLPEEILSASAFEILPYALKAEQKTSDALLRALYLQREYEVVVNRQSCGNHGANRSTKSASPAVEVSAPAFDNLGHSGACEESGEWPLGPFQGAILLPPSCESSSAIAQFQRFRSRNEALRNFLLKTNRTPEETRYTPHPISTPEPPVEVPQSTPLTFAQRVSAASHPGWPGVVLILDDTSPWYGGFFPFTLYFPDNYPNECPVLEMVGPWSTHPLLYSEKDQNDNGRRNSRHDVSPVALSPLSSFSNCRLSSLPGQHSFESPGVARGGDDTDPTQSSVEQHFLTASTKKNTPLRHFLPLEPLYSSLLSQSSLSTHTGNESLMARIVDHVNAVFSPRKWSPEFLQRACLSSNSSSPEEAGSLLTSKTPSSPPLSPHACPIKTKVELLNAVDLKKARVDVDRCSVSSGVTLASPFVHHLLYEVGPFFLSQNQQKKIAEGEDGGTAGTTTPGSMINVVEKDIAKQSEWIAWYGREMLPRVWKLPLELPVSVVEN